MSDLQCPVTLVVVAAGEALEALQEVADLHRGETVVVVADDVDALVRRLTGRPAPSPTSVRVEGDSDGWRLLPQESPER